MRHVLVPVGFRVLPCPLVRSVHSAVASAAGTAPVAATEASAADLEVVASAVAPELVAATQEVVGLEVAFEEAAPDLVAELAFAAAAAELH